MPRLARFGYLLIGIALFIPSKARTCSICKPGIKNRRTLREDVRFAKLVLFGYAANPKIVDSRTGKGRTEFHIQKRLKDDPFLGKKKMIVLERYIPVLDPKNPPRFLVFCDVFKGKLDPYAGRSVRSDDVLKYLSAAKAYEKKSRVEQLLFYFQYVNHDDEIISYDAFLEFAKSSDQEVSAAGSKLSPKVLRKLLAKPKLEPERISLYSYLLGACGEPRDADLLLSMLKDSTRTYRDALNGIYCGYIALRPKEGWKLALDTLADTDKSFSKRFAVLQAIVFFHQSKPKENRDEIVRGLKSLVLDGMVADLGIEYLRKWKLWDATETVIGQYGKKSHSSPIVKRAIVRYALACPLPQAKRFITDLEKTSPDLMDLIRELRENLMIEAE